MRTFKRIYYKPFALTVQLSDEEEQKIIDDLKEDGFEEGTESFEEVMEEALESVLIDKFYELAEKYMKKNGINIEPDYDEDIEEVK